MSGLLYRMWGSNKTRQDAVDTTNLINYNRERKNKMYMVWRTITCQQNALCLSDCGDEPIYGTLLFSDLRVRVAVMLQSVPFDHRRAIV